VNAASLLSKAIESSMDKPTEVTATTQNISTSEPNKSNRKRKNAVPAAPEVSGCLYKNDVKTERSPTKKAKPPLGRLKL